MVYNNDFVIPQNISTNTTERLVRITHRKTQEKKISVILSFQNIISIARCSINLFEASEEFPNVLL